MSRGIHRNTQCGYEVVEEEQNNFNGFEEKTGVQNYMKWGELGEGQLILYLMSLNLVLHLIMTFSLDPGDQITGMWKIIYEIEYASGYIL